MLSGRTILTRKIIINLPSASVQIQPCGVDLTLKSVSRFTGPGTLDFSNSRRQTAPTEKLSSSSDKHDRKVEGRWDLSDGTFLVEFNELVDVPLDCVGFLHPRSSLWRSGATIDAGVCDAGYKGALGALLEVKNSRGLKLYESARIAQIVFQPMNESIEEGYSGTYQGAASIGTGNEQEWKREPQ